MTTPRAVLVELGYRGGLEVAVEDVVAPRLPVAVRLAQLAALLAQPGAVIISTTATAGGRKRPLEERRPLDAALRAALSGVLYSVARRAGPFRDSVRAALCRDSRSKVRDRAVRHECAAIIAEYLRTGTIADWRLAASPQLLACLLNLEAYPELTDIPQRKDLLIAIMRTRYKGALQTNLRDELKVSSKSLFQVMKALYKLNLIRRLAISVPAAVEEGSGASPKSSTSAMVWLKGFFDYAKIDADIIRLNCASKIGPFKKAALQLLESQPNGIMLEKDFKLFFLEYFLPSPTRTDDDSSGYFCSFKTAHKFYQRVRKDLVGGETVKRVRAWCPATARIEACVILASSPAFNAEELRPMRDDEEEDDDVRVAPAATAPRAAPALDNNEDEEDDLLTAAAFKEPSLLPLPQSYEVLQILRTAGAEGLLSPAIAKALVITLKALQKPLVSLENHKLLVRRGERWGKLYIYRNVLTTYANQAIQPRPVATSLAIPKKMVTDAFDRRVQSFTALVLECGTAMIPEIARRFAAEEGTSNGPDRRTIQRVAAVVMDTQPIIKQGTIDENQQFLFYYNEQAFTSEAEAVEHMQAQLSKRRSETCRIAMRRNTAITLALTNDAGAADKERMIQALANDAQTMEKLEVSNPLSASKLSKRVMYELTVSPQVDEVNHRSRHDQRLLSHYGFIFPVMIRLQVFLKYLVTVTRESEEAIELKENGVVIGYGLPATTILKEMPLDVYLKTLGCGRREEYIEAYLHGGTPRCPDRSIEQSLRMKDLPAAVFERMTSGRTILRAASRLVDMRKACLKPLVNLLIKAVVLGCLHWKPALEKSSMREAVIPGVSGIWYVHSVAQELRFIEAPEELKTYRLDDEEDFEAFFSDLKLQCELWNRTQGSVDLPDPSPRRKIASRCPTNFPFPEAFSKRNWKASFQIDLKTRRVLNQLACDVAAREQAGARHSSQENEGAEPQAFWDLSAIQVLSPQSPEIVSVAQELKLVPDDVVRYLVQFFKTSGTSDLSKFANGVTSSSVTPSSYSLTVHNSRGLRYRCHLCGTMYAQYPSIINHYQRVHTCLPPEDESAWILPDELMRRRRVTHTSQSFMSTTRRKRRRKEFGRTVEDDHTDVVRFLSCVAVDEAPQDDCVVPPRTQAWWYSALHPLGEGVTRIVHLLKLAKSLTKKELTLLNELSVQSGNSSYHLGAEAQTLLQHFQLSEAEIAVMKKFLQDARRDDEYGLLAFLAVSERITQACNYYLARMTGSGDWPEELVNDMPSGAAPLHHPLWPTFSALFGELLLPPAAAHYVLTYCLNRYSSSLNTRILHTYRRLPARLLQECATAFSLPLKAEVLAYGRSEVLTSLNQKQQLLERNFLKVALVTPPSRYRAWWHQHLVTSASSWLHFLNATGAIVTSKRSMTKDLDAYIEFWEHAGRRKYSVSRGAQYLMYGRMREWKLLSQLSRTLGQLPEMAADINTDECRPLNAFGLTSGAVAGAVEAHAAKLVEIGSEWSASTTDESFSDARDEFAGLREPQQFTFDAEAAEASLMARLLRQPTSPQGMLPSEDITTSTAVSVDPEMRDSSSVESSSSSSESEDMGDEEDEDDDDAGSIQALSRRAGRGGVQRHLLKLTPEASDLDSPLWTPVAEEIAHVYSRERACSLLASHTEVDPAVCGNSPTGAQSDSISFETWLMPPTSLALAAWSTRDGLKSLMEAEKTLEYVDDAVNGWSLRVREARADNMPLSVTRTRKRHLLGGTVAANPKKATPTPTPCELLVGSALAQVPVEAFLVACQDCLGESDPLWIKLHRIFTTDASCFISQLLDTHYSVVLAREQGVWLSDILTRRVTAQGPGDLPNQEERELIDLVVHFLRLVRAVVSLPTPTDWLLLAPTCAAPHCLTLQPWVRRTGHGQDMTESEWVQWINADGSFPSDRDAETLVKSITGTKLCEAIVRPPWVPRRLWRLYGPAPESVKATVTVYGDATLSVDERRALSTVFVKAGRQHGSLLKLQRFFADLRAACAAMVAEEDQHLFLSTEYLNGQYRAPTVWMKSDGRIADSMVGALCVRIYNLCRQAPNITCGRLWESIGSVDRCELRELLDAMVEEGMLTEERHSFDGAASALETCSNYRHRLEAEDNVWDDPTNVVVATYQAHPQALLFTPD